jgi:guanylate kinase
MTDGKLILFCGPSGSGKTTIVQHLLKTFNVLAFSISATTRPMRTNEKHAVDYYFLSIEDFKMHIDKHHFIEWEEVYEGRYYGTLKSEIERIWQLNKVVAFDVDVEGGLNIKNQFGDRLLAVFVMPPSLEELHSRLKARATETPETLSARIQKAEHELTYAPRFDHIIVNNTMDKTLSEAELLVKKFLLS